MTNKEIGERIKKRRKELGFTLQEIADKVGVASSTIQRYENGTISQYKLPILESIAKVIKVNPVWLVKENVPMELEVNNNVFIEECYNSMNKTDKLKYIILSRYNSIREFANIVDIPSTTLTSALDNGIGGMAVDRIIKICETLNIDIKTFEPVVSIVNNNLSTEETILLENYNKLNNLGKEEASKRVSELTEISKYTYVEENIGRAAHNDFANDEEQQKLMQQDLDEL